MLIGFKAIAPGASHIEQDKVCQDAVDIYLPPPHNFGFIFAADGHGGDKYTRSNIGSEIAIKVAQDAFKDFLLQLTKKDFGEFLQELFHKPLQFDAEKMDKALGDLEKNIIYRWREKILEHLRDNPP
jgi:hypothetical protein